MPQEIIRKAIDTSDFGQQHERLHTVAATCWPEAHLCMCQENRSKGSTAGYISPLRVDGDVRPMLPHVMMTIAYSFDRSAIDIAEPLTEAP